MRIMNGHRTISEAEFLADDKTIAVYREGDSFPDNIRKYIYNHEEGEILLTDVITPLEKGKEWLFELTCKHQSRTGKLLIEGGQLFVRQTSGFHNLEEYAFHLGIEIQGKIIIMARGTWGNNLCDPNYVNYGNIEYKDSFPFGIKEAYYTRFDGLNIYPEQTVGVSSYMLPRPAISLCVIDYHLDRFKNNKKKQLQWFDEHFPHLAPKKKGEIRYGFREILNTIPFYDTYAGEKQTQLPLDFLFMKHDPQDGVVYHMVDDKVDEMRIVDDPVDVIDRYCEHVLLNKPERFDFLPFTSPLTF